MRIGTKSWGPSQIGAPGRPQNRPILGPILRAPGPGAQGPLGHLNVRERVYGPRTAQNPSRIGPKIGLPEAHSEAPPEQALGGPGPFERTRACIWAQTCPKGPQNRAPNRPPRGLFGASPGPGAQGPLGHLNVRERVFGPIPAQKGLRIGLPEASQEGLF